MSEWQPIDTVPSDERVLLWLDDVGTKDVVLGRAFKFHADRPATVSAEGYHGNWRFTHWRPLPPPPLDTRA